MKQTRSQDPEGEQKTLTEENPSKSAQSPVVLSNSPSTRFTSDTAREAAKRRWDAERAAAVGGGKAAGVDAGLSAPQGALDGMVELLRGIAEDRKAPEAARVTAVRAIAELSGAGGRVERPRTTGQLERMGREGRATLIRTMELAHHLPDTRNPN